MENEPRTTFEEKRYTETAADLALVKALRGKRGRLTQADAIAASGLPTHVVDESLERLLKQYRSHLDVTDDGELLYTFDAGLQRRDAPTLGERFRAAGRWLARAGMWVFKAWITVTLIAYVVAFVILVLSVLFGGNNNRRRRGPDIGWLWWFFLPDWRYGYGYGYRYDPWGRRLPAPRPRELGRGPKKKLIESVNDFVFGPARPAADPLADEREALAYIRANDGRITSTDLVALFGWSYRRAEEEATRLLVDYDGEPEVTGEGVLVYAFPKLLKSAETAVTPASDWKPCWQKPETRPVLTGNSRGADIAIGAFAGFNLFVSFFAAEWAKLRWGLAGPTWNFIFTVFPLIFFGLFLSIPATRAIARRLGDRGREARNRRRQAIKEVLAKDGGPFSLTPDYQTLALPLEGEPDVNAAGEAIITFRRVREEKVALKRYITGVDVGAERKLGEVIFGDREPGDQGPT